MSEHITYEARRHKHRAQYVARTTDLDYRKALALVYSEQGCSERGIAHNIDSTKTTVSHYLDEIAERYDPEAVVSVGVDEKEDLTPGEDQPTKGPLETVSHVCLDCRSLFTPVPVGVPDQYQGEGEDEDDDNVLVEAMQ